MVDIHTVGAGGGSIVWRDAGGAVRVGPESAGANPGPACYGRGGRAADGHRREPLLGRLPAAARRAVSSSTATRRSGRSAGFDPAAVVEVVNAEMLRALRVVSVERGHDPRDFALVAFGGAGPLHACALAEELGIATVLVPAAAGVLSALGLVASDERRDRVRSYVCPLDEAGDLPGGGRGRSPLPRPVVRADRRRSATTWPSASTARTRSATATRTASARDRARRRADRGVRPGPRLALSPAEPLEVSGLTGLGGPARAGSARTGRRDLLDRPRVGGGSGRDQRRSDK